MSSNGVRTFTLHPAGGLVASIGALPRETILLDIEGRRHVGTIRFEGELSVRLDVVPLPVEVTMTIERDVDAGLVAAVGMREFYVTEAEPGARTASEAST